MNDSDSTDCVVILNPESGTSDTSEEVKDRAELSGYEVRETERAGDAIEFAREAAVAGRSQIAAAGGDGTVNEVVRGVDSADALDDVTVGVVPTGTGNDFADNVGVTGIDRAFRLLREGERRRIDLGRANDRPFVNSCVGGLTAEASAETTPEMKRRFGVLAYVVSSLRTAVSFDGFHVVLQEDGEREPFWEGEAAIVLVGNARRFGGTGSGQANVEDGLFEVTVIEDVSGFDAMGESVVERLFGRAETVSRMLASGIELEVREDDPLEFSLDGEILEARGLNLDVDASALRVPVGPDYRPDPDVEKR